MKFVKYQKIDIEIVIAVFFFFLLNTNIFGSEEASTFLHSYLQQN